MKKMKLRRLIIKKKFFFRCHLFLSEVIKAIRWKQAYKFFNFIEIINQRHVLLS